MKKLSLLARICLLLVIVFFVVLMCGRRTLLSAPCDSRGLCNGKNNGKMGTSPMLKKMVKSGKEGGGVGMELSATGSSLPDCEHACGPCFPCKRVMVSFKCSSMAESCPTVYRCMCKGRFYHVPSN